MIDPAEALLLTTGLLKLPDKTGVRAALVVEKELDRELREALKRETQGRLYKLNAPRNYFDRLIKFFPDYGPMIEKLGPEIGAAFQVVQSHGATVMADRYPKTTVDTVLGPRPVPASEIDGAKYQILADTVEDHLRLVRDFAAGALVPDQVTLYREIFPTAYDTLLATLQDELAKREGKEPDWMPPLWLQDTIRVFRQQELVTFVRSDAPKQKQVAQAPAKLDMGDLIKAAEV